MSSEAIYARRWWTLAVLCLSLLVISLDNTILNVALPTLVFELDATASQLQWMVDAYVLVFAGLLLAAGSLGDKFGRRRALLLGFLIFALASVAAAYSGSADQLIASRAVMGIGGALIMPATLSILVNVFPREERPKAIAIWAATAGIGVPLGPVLGGWLLEHYWWGSVFLINIPIIIVAAAAALWLVPESRDERAPAIDFVGAGLSIAGLATLLYGIIEAPNAGWADPTTLVAFGAGVVLLGLFIAWELRIPQPMLDMRLFRNPRFSAGSISISLVFFALFGSIFLLTQYLQFVVGYTPLEAGVRIAPVAVGIILGTGLGQRMVHKVGTKYVVAAGMTIVSSGLLLGSTLDVDSSYWLVATMLTVFGFGMGSAMAPATDAIMGAVPEANAGVGSAVNDTVRQVGGALGVAVLGSLYSTVFSSKMEDVAAQLPPEASGPAQDSIGGALEVARRVGGEGAQALIASANNGFMDAMNVTFLAAAGVALGGALVALLFLPSADIETERAAESEAQDTTEAEPVTT